MRITEIQVRLAKPNRNRLLAVVSVTFGDAFVVHDMKVIQGNNGPFLAMPSRKRTDRCHRCQSKNHLQARHCNQCGAKLGADRAVSKPGRRQEFHTDVAHPIHMHFRKVLEAAVLNAYHETMEWTTNCVHSTDDSDDFILQ